MKNLLCRLGRHKPNPYLFHRVNKSNGKHKWHTNYVICQRCGKRIATLSINKKKGVDS